MRGGEGGSEGGESNDLLQGGSPLCFLCFLRHPTPEEKYTDDDYLNISLSPHTS